MLVRGSPRCCLRRTDFVAAALQLVRLARVCRRRGWLGPISRRWILVLARAPDLIDLEAREVRLTQGITAALRASLRPAGGFTVEAPSFGLLVLLLCWWWALCVAVVRCDGVRLAYATTGGMGPCSSAPGVSICAHPRLCWTPGVSIGSISMAAVSTGRTPLGEVAASTLIVVSSWVSVLLMICPVCWVLESCSEDVHVGHVGSALSPYAYGGIESYVRELHQLHGSPGSLKSCGFLRSQSEASAMSWNVVVRFEPGGLTVS